MKAINVLEWIVRQSIEGEFINFIEVPDENDEFTPQDEEWWMNFCGGIPPRPIPAGRYLYYYRDCYDWIEDEHGNYNLPDAEVEVDSDTIYLYLISD